MIRPAITNILNHLCKHIIMMFRPALQAPFKVPEKPFVQKISKSAGVWIGQVRIREVRQRKRVVRIHLSEFESTGFSHLIRSLLYKNTISRI
jgi:hypothetical protein